MAQVQCLTNTSILERKRKVSIGWLGCITTITTMSTPSHYRKGGAKVTGGATNGFKQWGVWIPGKSINNKYCSCECWVLWVRSFGHECMSSHIPPNVLALTLFGSYIGLCLFFKIVLRRVTSWALTSRVGNHSKRPGVIKMCDNLDQDLDQLDLRYR